MINEQYERDHSQHNCLPPILYWNDQWSQDTCIDVPIHNYRKVQTRFRMPPVLLCTHTKAICNFPQDIEVRVSILNIEFLCEQREMPLANVMWGQWCVKCSWHLERQWGVGCQSSYDLLLYWLWHCRHREGYNYNYTTTTIRGTYKTVSI
jgi:hypothetical protein